MFVSAAAEDDPRVLLAVGAIPTSGNTTVAPGSKPPTWVNFDRWTNMTALIVRGGPRRVNSWSDVISSYANTFGSHLSGTIPHILAETSTVHSGRQNLGEYLIHCAGIVAESALTQALTAAEGHAIVIPQAHRRLGPLVGIVLNDAPTAPFVQLSTGDTSDGHHSDNLLRTHFNGQYVTAGLEGNTKSQKVTFQWGVNRPDHWPD